MRKDLGFTITELVVVMALIAIVSAIALPTFFSTTMPHMKVKGAAREIYTLLQTARSKAVNSNKKWGVEFTLSTSGQDSYRLVSWNGASWAADAATASRTLERPVNIDNINGTAAGTFRVEFSPVGTATSTAGSAVNAEIRINRTTDTNDRLKVDVNPSTGYVKIDTGW